LFFVKKKENEPSGILSRFFGVSELLKETWQGTNRESRLRERQNATIFPVKK